MKTYDCRARSIVVRTLSPRTVSRQPLPCPILGGGRRPSPSDRSARSWRGKLIVEHHPQVLGEKKVEQVRERLREFGFVTREAIGRVEYLTRSRSA
jgi:hypothetical protein